MPALNGFTPWILAGVTLLAAGGGATAYIHNTFATKADVVALEEGQRRINQKLDFIIWYPYFPPPTADREDWPEYPDQKGPQPKGEEESLSADSNTRPRMYEPEIESRDSAVGGH